MESNKKIILTLIKVLPVLYMAVLISYGCSARKGVPYSEPVALETQELKEGQVLFETNCNRCHPGGTAGLGVALNNKPYPKFLIRFQVRHGFGAMPAFKEDKLSDEQVKNIAKYLVYLRKNG